MVSIATLATPFETESPITVAARRPGGMHPYGPLSRYVNHLAPSILSHFEGTDRQVPGPGCPVDQGSIPPGARTWMPASPDQTCRHMSGHDRRMVSQED
jgi:hypothetical protein